MPNDPFPRNSADLAALRALRMQIVQEEDLLGPFGELRRLAYGQFRQALVDQLDEAMDAILADEHAVDIFILYVLVDYMENPARDFEALLALRDKFERELAPHPSVGRVFDRFQALSRRDDLVSQLMRLNAAIENPASAAPSPARPANKSDGLSHPPMPWPRRRPPVTT